MRGDREGERATIRSNRRTDYSTAASRVPWSIARFASSSAATSAPPIRCASMSARRKLGVQRAIRFLARADHDRVDRQQLRACRRCGCAARRRRCARTRRRRASSRPSPSSVARCTQPVVLLSRSPGLPGVRCSSQTSRAGRLGRRRARGRRARRASCRCPIRASSARCRCVGDGGDCTRNSATSKPMPPAPMIATRSPGDAAAEQHVDIAHRRSDARCRESPRARGVTPRGDHDLVERVAQRRRRRARAQAQLDAGFADARARSSAASRGTPPCPECAWPC